MAKKPAGKPNKGAQNLRKYWTSMGAVQELERAKGGRMSQKAFLDMMTQMQKQAEGAAAKAPLGMMPVGPGQSRGPANQMKSVMDRLVGSNYMKGKLPVGKEYVPIATQKRGGALLQALMGKMGGVGDSIKGVGKWAKGSPMKAGLAATAAEMAVWAILSKLVGDAQQTRMFGLEKQAMQGQMEMNTPENMMAMMEGPMRDEELAMARARYMQAMGGGQYGGLASGEVAIP